MLSSICSIYKQRKDKVTANGKEWHRQIKRTVKKLHQKLDDMQKEHEALLQNQETEYKEMINRLGKINRKATSLQKSHDVQKIQTFIPFIKKQETLTEYSNSIRFQHFMNGKLMQIICKHISDTLKKDRKIKYLS